VIEMVNDEISKKNCNFQKKKNHENFWDFIIHVIVLIKIVKMMKFQRKTAISKKKKITKISFWYILLISMKLVSLRHMKSINNFEYQEITHQFP
jgi:hypothetical protein